MRFRQLTIEEKRNVSIELLLQLEELQLRFIPGPRLDHGRAHFITLGVVGKKIDHASLLDPGRPRGGGRGSFLGHDAVSACDLIGRRAYGKIVGFAIGR